MFRFLLFLLRLVAITVAFVIACAVAACMNLVLNSTMIPGALADLHARGLDPRLIFGLAGLTSLFGHAAFLPSAVLILIAEFARLRSWLVYTVGGGLVSGIVLVLAERAGTAIAFDPRHVSVDLVCGMIAGLGYWILAGNRAGRWLPSEIDARNRASRPASAPGSEES